MNFLAHLYLSGENTSIMLGNFIADFVKGKNLLEKVGPEIAKGIELHREIDFFTDQHPIVRESKNRLRPKYHHYSAVIVDVFYDHFLAKNWHDYHAELLADYANHVYAIIQKNAPLLPERVNLMMPYMIKGNWLLNYAELEGIHRALTGMTRRTPYESRMDESISELRENYEEFKSEFEAFFPELKSHCNAWLTKNQLLII
jgi:acyl carrier protein phosphodiesterase